MGRCRVIVRPAVPRECVRTTGVGMNLDVRFVSVENVVLLLCVKGVVMYVLVALRYASYSQILELDDHYKPIVEGVNVELGVL